MQGMSKIEQQAADKVVSYAVIAKGEQIVREGKVRRILRNRFLVRSISGRLYFVHNGKCRCKWNQYPAAQARVCSHEYAALLTQARRQRRKLFA